VLVGDGAGCAVGGCVGAAVVVVGCVGGGGGAGGLEDALPSLTFTFRAAPAAVLGTVGSEVGAGVELVGAGVVLVVVVVGGGGFGAFGFVVTAG
jgi:hypothetical protein